jgi:two-component system phosphate regulon sensor histidine kinase PhoR
MGVGFLSWRVLGLPLFLMTVGILTSFGINRVREYWWFEQQASEITRETHLLCRTLSVASNRTGWLDFVESFRKMHLGEVELISSDRLGEGERKGFVLAPIEWISEPERFYRLRCRQPIEKSDGDDSSIDEAMMDWMVVTRRVQQPRDGTTRRTFLFGVLGLLFGSIGVFWRFRTESKIDLISDSLSEIRAKSQKGIPRPEFLGMFPHAMRSDRLGREVIALCDTLHQNAFSFKSDGEPSDAILAAMPVGILAFGPELRMSFANRAAVRLLNLGESIQEHIPLIELIRQPKILSLVQDVRSGGISLECEFETTDSYGSTVTLKIRGHTIVQDGSGSGEGSTVRKSLGAGRSNKEVVGQSPPSVLLVISDETRLKQLENYRRDFTANVSHELKTPLSAIKAYSETLLMGALDDPDARIRFVTSIGEQANRLEQLIRGLMQLSRIQSMPEKLELVEIRLVDIVGSVIREQSTVAESNQIMVVNHLASEEMRELDPVVLAEHDALRTVFGNLLSNAIRYSKKGGKVEVGIEVLEDRIDLLVVDYGIGIPAEDINRIFERFYTVDKARSRESGGTGLGLAIVKHLTHAIGAGIQVSSTLGSGSTFRVSLRRPE